MSKNHDHSGKFAPSLNISYKPQSKASQVLYFIKLKKNVRFSRKTFSFLIYQVSCCLKLEVIDFSNSKFNFFRTLVILHKLKGKFKSNISTLLFCTKI